MDPSSVYVEATDAMKKENAGMRNVDTVKVLSHRMRCRMHCIGLRRRAAPHPVYKTLNSIESSGTIADDAGRARRRRRRRN